MKKDAELDFSYGLEAGLTDDERLADKKLLEWRDEIASPVKNLTIHNFFVHNETMKKCKLYRALNVMPKGALHHVHTSAANPIECLLHLVDDPTVFYSKRDKLFKVYPKWDK